jgi:hypothetical protein
MSEEKHKSGLQQIHSRTVLSLLTGLALYVLGSTYKDVIGIPEASTWQQRVLRGSSKGVTRVLQEFYKDITELLQWN